MIVEFPIEIHLVRGLSIAMFDSQRVTLVFRKFLECASSGVVWSG